MLLEDETRKLLKRARNLLSHPSNWVTTEEHEVLRLKLIEDIQQQLYPSGIEEV